MLFFWELRDGLDQLLHKWANLFGPQFWNFSHLPPNDFRFSFEREVVATLFHTKRTGNQG
jgi:hypothetical protein